MYKIKRKKTARLSATFSVFLFTRVCVAVEPVYLTFDASYLVGGWARMRPADLVWILLKGHDTPRQGCVVGWRRSSLGCFKIAWELFSTFGFTTRLYLFSVVPFWTQGCDRVQLAPHFSRTRPPRQSG